jgi:hypothetical protein
LNMTRLISSLCAALVLSIGVVANAAPMATATIKQTGASTFSLLLQANTDANFGVANYLLPIAGASTFVHSRPRLTIDPDGTGESNFAVGFTQFPSGANALTVQAGQSLDSAVPVAYGLGQQVGTLTSLIPAGGAASGSTAFAGYAVPMVIGTGTFAGALPTWANSADNAAVQLYASTSGRNGPLTKVSSGNLILAVDGGVVVPPAVLVSNPVPGAGIELDFGTLLTPQISTPPKSIALSNSAAGSNPISISSITLAGPDAGKYALQGTLPTSLAGGAAAQSFNVAWNAPGTAAGTYLAQVLVNTSAGNLVFDVRATVPEPATLALAGLAVVGLVGFARRS